MKMGETKYVMKHEMHLSLQFFGMVNKQKIELDIHFRCKQINVRVKKLDIFE